MALLGDEIEATSALLAMGSDEPRQSGSVRSLHRRPSLDFVAKQRNDARERVR